MLRRLFARRRRHAKQERLGSTPLIPDSVTPTCGEDRRDLSKPISLRTAMNDTGSEPIEPRSEAQKQWYPSRSLVAQIAAVGNLFPEHQLAKENYTGSTTTALKDVTNSDVPGNALRNKAHRVRSLVSPHVDPILADAHPNQGEAAPNYVHSSIEYTNDRLSKDCPIAPRDSVLASNQSNRNDTHDTAPISYRASEALPLTTRKRSSINVRPHSTGSPIFCFEERRSSLSRKPNIFNLRDASVEHVRSSSLATNKSIRDGAQPRRKPIKRSDLDKPLPLKPIELPSALTHDDRAMDLGPQKITSQEAPHNLAELANNFLSEDTIVHKRWAPAIMHETITRNVHEIREEHVTREIHNHHVYHRVLPVADIELLPARHFLAVDGAYVEVAEGDIPPGSRPSSEWMMAEVIAKLYPKPDGQDHPLPQSKAEWSTRSTPDIASWEATQKGTITVLPANMASATGAVRNREKPRTGIDPVERRLATSAPSIERVHIHTRRHSDDPRAKKTVTSDGRNWSPSIPPSVLSSTDKVEVTLNAWRTSW